MQALCWDGLAARVEERGMPKCTADAAVVRVKLAGVCDTDLQLVRGYMGFRGILGHEMVGVVTEGPARWLGRRVVSEINFGCGHCPDCARGLARHCPARRVMGILNADGAFAEYTAVPVANLHAVPEAVADEEAVFTEPLAAAFEILEQVPLRSDVHAIVLGDGKLGLLVAQVLADAGARVLVVGKHPRKLEIARRRGIAAVLLEDWDRTPGDLVVEATGSTAGCQLAIAATRPRGTLVLKSTVAGSVTLDLSPLVVNEVTVVGSRCGRFEPALRALEGGRVDVRALIAARWPLREAATALRVAAEPGTLKVLIENP